MATTPNRNYPLINNGSPTGGIDLNIDIATLLTFIGMVDADVQSVITALAGKVGSVSPAFSGSPTAPTQATGDDSNKLATTAFVKAANALAIANLVNGAPSTLDALNELAAALGNDPNFATTVATQIGLKANSADIYIKTVIDAFLAAKQDIASRGSLSGLRNRLLNPSGEIIQRFAPTGTTIAAGASAYVFDRWLVTNNTNQPVVVSQNLLAPGSGFAMAARYTMRHTFAAAPTSGTLRLAQRIEYVTSIKPGAWTLTSWLSGPSGTETLAAEIVQNFGSGGSPSAPVTTPMVFAGGSPTTIYSASTNRRCWGVTVPALTSKLLGNAGNDYLEAAMVLTPRQAGNYDVTWSSFVEGYEAAGETDPQSPRHTQQEFALCQRFYQRSNGYVAMRSSGYSANARAYGQHYPFPIWMRATPTLGVPNVVYTTSNSLSFENVTTAGFGAIAVASADSSNATNFTWTADAEF